MGSESLSRGVAVCLAQELCLFKQENGSPSGSKQAKADVLLTRVVGPLRGDPRGDARADVPIKLSAAGAAFTGTGSNRAVTASWSGRGHARRRPPHRRPTAQVARVGAASQSAPTADGRGWVAVAAAGRCHRAMAAWRGPVDPPREPEMRASRARVAAGWGHRSASAHGRHLRKASVFLLMTRRHGTV